MSDHYLSGTTSYSQFGEDVALWRFLRKDTAPATYVDVGCNDPYYYSNTALLYENGWSGVVIDPNPDFAVQYKALRSRDIFEPFGVGKTKGSMEYYTFEASQYNTFDANQADALAKNGNPYKKIKKIPIDRLENILKRIWPNGKQIRFLNVDVEGFDLQVLESHDFDQFPVEFICVEVDTFNILDTCRSETLSWLREMKFIPVAQLFKSLILVSEKSTNEWFPK